MATYNGAQFIKEQIASILPQLSPCDELIISDDGSTDETIAIAKNFNSALIKIINGPRAGLIKNFENSIKNAAGDIIFLSDQDDIWHPEKVKHCLSELSQSKADLLVTDCTIINSEGMVLEDSFFKKRGSGPGLIKNIVKNSFLGCCMVFRSELKEKILPFPKNIAMHDWWIGLVASVHGKVVFVKKPLSSYRRHGNNASPTGERSKYSRKQQMAFRLVIFFNLLKNQY